MKKKTKKEQQAEQAIVDQLIASLKFIENNMGYLNNLDWLDKYPIEAAATHLGFSLVQTKNLSEFYLAQEFCNINNLQFIGTF